MVGKEAMVGKEGWLGRRRVPKGWLGRTSTWRPKGMVGKEARTCLKGLACAATRRVGEKVPMYWKGGATQQNGCSEALILPSMKSDVVNFRYLARTHKHACTHMFV